MILRRNAMLGMAAAALLVGGDAATRANDWPNPAATARNCRWCGQPVTTSFYSSAGQLYHDACVPSPAPLAPSMPYPAENRAGPTGQAGPMPERPSTIPGAPTEPGQPGAGTGAGAEPGTGAGAGAGTTPEAEAAANALAEAAAEAPAASSALGGGMGAPGAAFAMLGDQAPIFGRPTPPPRPNQPRAPQPVNGVLAQKGKTVIPYVRSFKIADNMSPVPQDRVYFNFNYFNNANYAVNRQFGNPVTGIQIYRYLLGFEKTFLDGMGSIGIRDSINTLSSTSRLPGVGGTSTSMGDLSVFAKMVLYQEWEDARYPSAFGGFGYPTQVGGRNGYLISAGLDLTLPTGPGSFAGASFSKSFRDTRIQPFIGYFYSRNNFYLQGFESIDIPTDPNDVLMLYNDVGMGYYLYRNPESPFLTAFAPTFEVHVNVPLNHRDVFNPNDPVGTADIVDLTSGGNLQFGQRTVLLLGAVVPVSGPRPFSIEAVALLNVYFGGRRATPPGMTYPMAGQ